VTFFAFTTDSECNDSSICIARQCQPAPKVKESINTFPFLESLTNFANTPKYAC